MHHRSADLPVIRLAPGEDVALARAVEAGVYAAHLVKEHGQDSRLARVAEAGRGASERLWWAGSRIAAHLAHQVATTQRLPVDDLLQDAYVALTESVLRYDHARGMRFSSFVYQSVTQALVEAYRHRPGTLPPSRGDRWAASLAANERNRLALLGIPVTLADAARTAGVSTTAAARGAMATVSLGMEWADDLPAAADDDPIGCGTDFLALLQPTHARILAARHGIGRPARTIAQLAAELNHSPSTIARWEKAALAEARTLLSAERMTMSRPEPVSRARRPRASSAASPVR
ncbi:MAG TPA: sigma factor [Arachnia sp.]|jgi:hypothetical protein|nr:sigma factor [Arachnia sp.]HMR14591.1 sigma factor [Arachnia sp.]